MKHPVDKGFAYINMAAILIVLNNTAETAEAVAKWFKDVVEARLAKVKDPLFPKAKKLEEVLQKAEEHGFVMCNYITVANQIQFLLEFEKLRTKKV